MNAFLKDDGSPDLSCLQAMANRCAPAVTFLDNTRFCRWPNQFLDGRKHDRGSDHPAKPWDGASDCRPFVVDDIINECVAMKTTAFWRAMVRAGAGSTEEGSYALALAEHLLNTTLYDALTREVELSAQYEEHYGWTVIAPRWRREIGLQRRTVTIEMIQQEALAYAQQLAAASQQNPNAPQPEDNGLTQLPSMIMDPTQETLAAQWLQEWYDDYVKKSLPEDLQDRAPEVALSTARRVVRELRTTGKSSVPLPYLCQNQPEICALKPWDEVFLPPEFMDAQTMVIQAERVTEPELRNRIITEDYDPKWVDEAVKYKGQISQQMGLPTGTGGNLVSQLSGGVVPLATPSMTPGSDRSGLIEILHAVYRDVDADGVPGIYMTTFHRNVKADTSDGQLYAKHGLADSLDGEMLYVAGVREWWCRSVTASRSVPETASTQQNIIKGQLDLILDRGSILTAPPVNIYESPTGSKYKFAPFQQNFVRKGFEPTFMEGAGGMTDGLEGLQIVRSMLDNRFGQLSENVPATRVQMKQAMAVQRFLLTWSKVLQGVLSLCQQYMPDEEFAEITGAEPGWLESRRQAGAIFHCELHFDVGELDPDTFIKRIDAVNKSVLPSDVLGTVNRAKWTRVMMRGINPAWAREVLMPEADASQALFDRARQEVIQMFAGNTPRFVDKNDPTAEGLLNFTKQIVMANPVYLKALDNEAITALAGDQAPVVMQQIVAQGGQRAPNERFSQLLVQWVKNLTFIGVTQPENRKTGAIGVNPDKTTPQG